MTSLGYLQYSDINMDNSTTSEIDKKRLSKHNTTIKKKPTSNSPGSSENVQNMLKLINNSNGYDIDNENDESSGLYDFNPPPRAQVQQGKHVLTNKTTDTNINIENVEIDYEIPAKRDGKRSNLEQMNDGLQMPMTNNMMQNAMMQNATPTIQAPMSNQSSYVSPLLNSYVDSFSQQTMPNMPNNMSGSKDQLIDKLNYMIYLLEEQKDEKTGHVMEEVILYSFLGVFIIFIVDSFARAGKYTR